MKSIYRYLFSSLGILLGMVVLVLLIVLPEPKINLLLMLLALGMTSQGIALIDQMDTSDEKKKQQE